MTAAFRSAEITAAVIFAPSIESLETGVERRVSSVLSIFSVDIAVIIICDAIITMKNSAMGTIIDCIMRTALRLSLGTSADFPLSTEISVILTGAFILAISSSVMPYVLRRISSSAASSISEITPDAVMLFIEEIIPPVPTELTTLRGAGSLLTSTLSVKPSGIMTALLMSSL